MVFKEVSDDIAISLSLQEGWFYYYYYYYYYYFMIRTNNKKLQHFDPPEVIFKCELKMFK